MSHISRKNQSLRLFGLYVFSFLLFSIPASVLADKHFPLDRGYYAYAGLGFAASTLIGKDNAAHRSSQTVSHTQWDLGFIWKRLPAPGRRSMLQLSYRPLSFDAYKRTAYSLDLLESYAYVNGFSPFVGLSVNYDQLTFSLPGEDALTSNDFHLGFAGGWDLMPSLDSRWMIRSVFRWYPDISLRTAGGDQVAFPNFEYNFFQFMFRFN